MTLNTTNSPTTDPFIRERSTKIHGRVVEADTELSITGGGRCRFVALVTNPRSNHQWVDVVNKRGQVRSFPVSAVTAVHRLTKTRENAA